MRLARKGFRQDGFDGCCRWCSDRGASGNVWLSRHEESDAAGSIVVAERLLPAHGAGYHDADSASRVGSLGVLIRNQYFHRFTWFSAKTEFVQCRIRRTLGSHGVDILYGLGRRADPRNSATYQGRAIQLVADVEGEYRAWTHSRLSARDAEDAKGSAFLHYRPTVPCTDFSGCRPIPSVGVTSPYHSSLTSTSEGTKIQAVNC